MWFDKDSKRFLAQLLHVPVLFDFAVEDTDLILGHNLQRVLVNVFVLVKHNKMSTTHS